MIQQYGQDTAGNIARTPEKLFLDESVPLEQSS